MVKIDANEQSFFKHVIEQRAANESDPALHFWLKILANSGSYGLFVELNPNDADREKLKVFSGEESFETTSDVVEQPGKWFAPHIGSLLTAGGRLLLAMLERCIADAGGTYLFCDTDSAAIVSTEHRQQIATPDGAEPITVLSHSEVDEIVQAFEKLNPYNLKGSILKVHKLNWNQNGKRRQLHGYSIAAKRYALYTKTKDDIEIVEPKAHGLGYFYPPKDSPQGWEHETPQWIFEAWNWITRCSGIKTSRAIMVRSSGDDETGAKHAESCTEKRRQGTPHAPQQFHDDSADAAFRISATRGSKQMHVHHVILI